jgi:hypothetical protein
VLDLGEHPPRLDEKEVAAIAALTFAIVAINGWNRLGVGLRSDVMTLDGLNLPAAESRSEE